ncbi:STAS domain-containing protein [Streptomyces hokutonensis]|uniref:STAS domain-containing protein n=1 Tax=Streptomyces hokutonensis TaxID=1306990 RepID=UPI0034E2940B
MAGPGLADPITLSTQLCESCAVVRFGGELDYASSWFVAELLRDLRTQGRVHYVVVFEEAALLDSAGLNTFLAHLDAVRALGGSMRVVIESSVIRRVFEVTGVDGVLLVDHSLDEAMTAMRATANCPDQ